MKKLFALLAIAFSVATSAQAENLVISADNVELGSATFTGVVGESQYSMYLGTDEKKWLKGNGSFSIDNSTYLSLKNTNGVQVTLTLPDGVKASAITFYVTTNSDSSGKLTEVNGSAYEIEVTSLKSYDTPNVINVDFEQSTSNVTFTFSGKQVCFVAVVTLQEQDAAVGLQTVENIEEKAYDMMGREVKNTAAYRMAKKGNGKTVVIR